MPYDQMQYSSTPGVEYNTSFDAGQFGSAQDAFNSWDIANIADWDSTNGLNLGGQGQKGFAANLFDGKYGSLQGWGTALGGAGDLFNAYNAWQSGKLAKEQFGFQKDAFNRNLSNQATTVNEDRNRRQSARNSMTGGNRQIAQVNGSAIG